MRMLNDNILVKELNEETVTAGGLILTGDSTKSCKTVIVVSPDKDDSLKVGDKLCIPNHAGIEYKHEGEPHLIIKMREVIFIEK